MKFSLAVLAASASGALAHYNFERLILNGAQTGAYEYVRRTSNSNSPVTSVTSNDIRCNVGGGSGASTSTATVASGATVGFYINSGFGHPGPLMVYMSKAPGLAKDYDGSGSWFKVYEAGPADFTSSGIKWKADGLSTFTFKIPSNIPAGEYLIRGEHIALHGASSSGGAQFYIGCAQVKISSGSGSVPAGVSFPGAYKATDPGILFQPYWPVPTTYTMPGPKVVSGGTTAKRDHARDFE